MNMNRPPSDVPSEIERVERDAMLAANLRSMASYPREMQAILDILADGPAHPDSFPVEIRQSLKIMADLEGYGAPLRFDAVGRLDISRVPHVRDAVELYARIARPPAEFGAADPADGRLRGSEVTGGTAGGSR